MLRSRLRLLACRVGSGLVVGAMPCAALAQADAAVLQAAAQGPSASAIEAQARAMRRASDAVLGVRARAVADARSTATLGTVREGSGVVIGRDGLVLTIGYLLLEAEQVQLLTDAGRELPARVVAHDVATGLGLVQALLPLGLEPVPLGNPAATRDDEPLTVASGGPDAEVSTARLASRRAFAAAWEYALDTALFTAPPRRDQAGAALFNGRGELLGVGSLLVSDAAGPGQPRTPGNMFVPVDVLAPVLQELLERGRSAASQRPWLGLNCVEAAGEVRVARVADDSPADAAGLRRGDRILQIDGVSVTSLGLLWKTLWATAPAQRSVRLQIERGGGPVDLLVHAVDRALTLRRPEGI